MLEVNVEDAEGGELRFGDNGELVTPTEPDML